MKFSLFVSWLKRAIPKVLALLFRVFARVLMPAARPALAEDLRKMGVAAMGVGLVGAIVNGVAITRGDALLVLAAGCILWVFGLWLSTLPTEKE